MIGSGSVSSPRACSEATAATVTKVIRVSKSARRLWKRGMSYGLQVVGPEEVNWRPSSPKQQHHNNVDFAKL